MPHRLLNMVAPLAQLHARKMTPAFEALCATACTDSALASALVARGVSPGIAQITVEQWKSLGLLIPPEVFAPAHVLESTLLGTVGPVAQQVAAVQPWLARSIALSPGYERAMAALPGVAGIAPGLAGIAPFGVPGITGYERMMGISPFISPMGVPFGAVPGIRGVFDPA